MLGVRFVGCFYSLISSSAKRTGRNIVGEKIKLLNLQSASGLIETNLKFEFGWLNKKKRSLKKCLETFRFPCAGLIREAEIRALGRNTQNSTRLGILKIP